MEFDSKNLTVGSRVMVTRHYYGKVSHQIGAVVKITPSGLIDVKFGSTVTRFNRNGTLYHRELYSSTWAKLSVPTDAEVLMVAEENKRRYLINALSSCEFGKLPTENLEKIYELSVKHLAVAVDLALQSAT